jgi:hypothetical protein
MFSSRTRVIHERTNILPIQQILSTSKKEILSDYSLKQNFFDPSKSSPPNDFLLKLQMRMNVYESLGIKDDKRESE